MPIFALCNFADKSSSSPAKMNASLYPLTEKNNSDDITNEPLPILVIVCNSVNLSINLFNRPSKVWYFAFMR
jgi:hypothetical protein